MLADGWMVIAFGTAADRRAFFGEAVRISAKDRLYAMTELRDTAVGRPKQTLEHEGFSGVPMFALPGGAMPGVSPIRPPAAGSAGDGAGTGR